MRSKMVSSCIMAGIMAAELYVPFVQADYSALPPQMLPRPVQNGDTSYVTGGIGDEERNALRAMRRNYNLAIVSADKTGAYTGHTHIIIRDRQGNEKVDAANAGPLFYAKLPPGRYVAEAATDGQQQSHAFTVANGHPATIQFRWQPGPDRAGEPNPPPNPTGQ